MTVTATAQEAVQPAEGQRISPLVQQISQAEQAYSSYQHAVGERNKLINNNMEFGWQPPPEPEMTPEAKEGKHFDDIRQQANGEITKLTRQLGKNPSAAAEINQLITRVKDTHGMDPAEKLLTAAEHLRKVYPLLYPEKFAHVRLILESNPDVLSLDPGFIRSIADTIDRASNKDPFVYEDHNVVKIFDALAAHSSGEDRRHYAFLANRGRGASGIRELLHDETTPQKREKTAKLFQITPEQAQVVRIYYDLRIPERLALLADQLPDGPEKEALRAKAAGAVAGLMNEHRSVDYKKDQPLFRAYGDAVAAALIALTPPEVTTMEIMTNHATLPDKDMTELFQQLYNDHDHYGVLGIPYVEGLLQKDHGRRIDDRRAARAQEERLAADEQAEQEKLALEAKRSAFEAVATNPLYKDTIYFLQRGEPTTQGLANAEKRIEQLQTEQAIPANVADFIKKVALAYHDLISVDGLLTPSEEIKKSGGFFGFFQKTITERSYRLNETEVDRRMASIKADIEAFYPDALAQKQALEILQQACGKIYASS